MRLAGVFIVLFWVYCIVMDLTGHFVSPGWPG